MPLLVAIDFEGGTSHSTTNQAGIAILDPNTLEGLDAISIEFASKMRTSYMLVAGREHFYPSIMAEKRMQIYKNDKHTDHPRLPALKVLPDQRVSYIHKLTAEMKRGTYRTLK